MKLAFTAAALAAPLLSAPLLSAPALAVPQEPEQDETKPAPTLEELAESIQRERDDVEPEVLETIGEMGTREAMEVLVEAYETFGSVFMRREALLQLNRFDGVEDAYQPALATLMNVAVGARDLELREAALERLGRCTQHGTEFLALIVESAADPVIREEAMRLHVNLGGREHDGWYRRMYELTRQVAWQKRQEERQKAADEAKAREREERKKRRGRRRGGDDEETPPAPRQEEPLVWSTEPIRAIAMERIVDQLDDETLLREATTPQVSSVPRIAVAALVSRGHDDAEELVEALLQSPYQTPADRVVAAGLLLQLDEKRAPKELIDVAKAESTPAALRYGIADLLSELDDEKVNATLAKMVGKGKPHHKAFALRATRHIDDEKLVKKIRKDVRDKEQDVAVAAIRELAARRDRESVDDMLKVLERTRLDGVRVAALRGISAIYDGENEWLDRLEADYATADDVDLRNAALMEIARLGRRNRVDVFLANLDHPNWSTRLVCLKALEAQRSVALLEPIVSRMQEEEGRMLVEFGESLFRLTGQRFGKRAKAWRAWLDGDEAEVAVLSPEEIERLVAANERRRLLQTSRASFFGIRIDSLRVHFIIDCSGSMQQPTRGRYTDRRVRPRIEVAKEELVGAVQSLDARALFNIAPFATDVDSWLEDGVVQAQEEAREEAIEYAQALVADGGTNLYGALEYAFEDPDIDTIFVLSDGEPSVGDLIDPQSIRDAVAEMNATRGVVIHTIAIGGSLDVLEWLAEDSGGTHVQYE